MDEIKRIETRDELVSLARELGVRPDWHEPDEQEVTAEALGSSFDNAGFWGWAEVSRTDRIAPDGLEQWVIISQHGEPVAEVNLATLFAFATGFEG